ncbi:cadherin-related family member 5 isoform X2 [Pungitius pungitius]|uniref:cadherin-related family member 5 isoform X2 n=1 Tax=Pungitius pungitius TaxID=134920 RepID=UPI002E0EA7EA
MEAIHPGFTSFCWLLLILLPTSDAQICSAKSQVEFTENNVVGAPVLEITIEENVILGFKAPVSPDNPFSLEGTRLIANRKLDYETERTYAVNIICTKTTTGEEFPLTIIVLLVNLNDNLPLFDQDSYSVSVNELSPVGTTVGRFAATDLDGQQLSYSLTPESKGFKLKSQTNPDLLVEMPLNYEKDPTVHLVLTAVEAPLGGVSHSATTTINLSILDGDNRPPWFQPCSKYEVGGAVVCQNNGYSGRVVMNEREPGALPLDPGPLYAIDGDAGIGDEVAYSILSGDNGNLFEINPDSGNITMKKAADQLGTIGLTVLAVQKTNSYQFATTSVTISVQVKSLHQPEFQRLQYEGVVSGVGVMATELNTKDEPLRILATDDDYSGGINPYISYFVTGSSDFAIVGGYLFLTKAHADGPLSLQLRAVDTTNNEEASASLFVEVISGLTTTSLPPNTTNTTSSTVSMTSEEVFTSDPTASTSISLSTASTSLSTASTSLSTATTTNPTAVAPGAPGAFGVVDMAALGATLAVLLLVCLAAIVALVFRIRKADANGKKVFEASVFQSSLGKGGPKGGIQFTNEAFQHDEDGDNLGSGSPAATHFEESDDLPVKSSVPLRSVPHGGGDDDDDDGSQAGSDSGDSVGKDVKPILTKERRVDDGYKSVWFKEDIDPDAKDEVVIIPDSEEEEEEDEDQKPPSGSREEDEDEGPRVRTRRVGFNDTDLDSGLGVKMDDPEDDSEGDEDINNYL